MIVIPKEPEELHLSIAREWDGNVCEDDRIHADLAISQTPQGLRVRAQMPILYDQKIPDTQKGTRFDMLWEFDVVELFLVGPGHRYLEIELGAGGHWLILGFDRIRHREHAYEGLQPLFRYWKTEDRHWVSQIVIPWEIVPENLRALNAFVIASGKFLAFSAVPGLKPDFHQPDAYPAAKLA